jgi:hypothetical protein
MFGLFALIALVGFWAGVVWVWLADGPKIPLIFAALWIIGLFVFPKVHSPIALFLPFECVLAVVLILMGKYRSMV